MSTVLQVVKYKDEEFGIQILDESTNQKLTVLLDSDQWFQIEEQSARVANELIKLHGLTSVA